MSAISICGAFFEATCQRDARDAAVGSVGAPFGWTGGAAHDDAIGAAAMICRWQHGASATASALPWRFSAWALPPRAKMMATGAATAAITTGDFRPPLANL